MIQANTNNRWAQLSQGEKAELLGIYTRQGYNNLASIIAHYNSCGGNLYSDGGPEGEQKPSLKKRLAYKLGSAAKEGAGLTIPGIFDALVSHQKEYDELDAYLNGPDEHFEPFTEEVKGPIAGKKWEGIPQYKAKINPTGEYLFPEEWRNIIELAAQNGTTIYQNADKAFEYSPGYRYDAANYPMIIGQNDNGYVINSADLYDFDKDYADRYTEKSKPFKKALVKAEIGMMRKAGNPYIVREEGIPIRFIGENGTKEEKDLAHQTILGIGKGETGNEFDENTAIDKILNRMGLYTGASSEIIEDMPDYLRYSSGGKIHIKPENRGKFTALKKRTGHSASWFKAHGTPAQKKMAVFALNARKWRHDDGGFINTFEDGGDEDRVPWYRIPVRVPNMTGTATAAATSLRDIPLTDSTVGRELAVAGTAMLPLAPYLGHSAAVGIDTMGRMAMPSTFLKGVSYYAPKAAGALSAVSPWLDAGALSLWSAEAGKAAIDAGKRGDTGNAMGYGALAALPVVMPLVMKAYSAIKSVPNLPDIEKEGKIAYRVIDDAGLSDIINSGIIRPNQAGPYAHSGVQGGTWFSLDKPATHRHPTVLPNGNTVSYRGNYVIEIGEKSPQFPTGTTPGTVDLNYRLGAMEIDPRDPRIRIYDRRRGKYLKPEDYTVNAQSDKLLWETPPVVSTAAEATPAIVQKSVEQVVPKYEISDLGGGYMLKSLMRGNPLEKQISRNGTVNVNNVRALVGKGSKVEQAVVDKVLAFEEFAGKKSIDYNKFRKAVQDELITYERTPDTRFENYGIERLGLHDLEEVTSHPNVRKRFDEFFDYNVTTDGLDNYYLRGDLNTKMSFNDLASFYFKEVDPMTIPLNTAYPKTFTFSSSHIPKGSGKHYNPNTLGHSRTYTTFDEPDVLHVMESQSDWGQGYKKMNLDGEYNQKRINSLERRMNNLKESINSETEGLRTEKMNDGSDMSPWFADSLRKQIEKDKQLLEELTVELDMRRNPKLAAQQDYLAENFTSRQIQENLRYAAEKGQTKMRYPTKETAAKIEGYPKETNYYDADGNLVTDSRKIYTIGKENEKELDLIQRELDGYYAKFNIAQLPNGDYVPAGNYSDNPYQQLIEAIPRKQAAYDGWRANHPNATSEKGQRIVDDMKRRAEEIKNFRARVKYLNQRMKELKSIKPYVDPSIKKEVKYMHEDDILRKYNEFPKQFKKLYKGADVRMVTDPKGNTWYEVDVPENYLQQEWVYKNGGQLQQYADFSGFF